MALTRALTAETEMKRSHKSNSDSKKKTESKKVVEVEKPTPEPVTQEPKVETQPTNIKPADQSINSFKKYDIKFDELYKEDLVKRVTEPGNVRLEMLTEAATALKKNIDILDEKELLSADRAIWLRVGTLNSKPFIQKRPMRIHPFERERVCVFVKNPETNFVRDSLLGIPEIKEVISARRFAKENPEVQNILAFKAQYTFFLVDAALKEVMHDHLIKPGSKGCFAYENFPIMTERPIDLRKTSNMIHSTYYHTHRNMSIAKDGRFQIKIGLSNQSVAQIIENTIDTIARLTQMSVDWLNFESFALFASDLPDFTFYQSPVIEKLIADCLTSPGWKFSEAFTQRFEKLKEKEAIKETHRERVAKKYEDLGPDFDDSDEDDEDGDEDSDDEGMEQEGKKEDSISEQEEEVQITEKSKSKPKNKKDHKRRKVDHK